MKAFLKKVIVFAGILLLISITTILYLPNLAIDNSLYFALLDKHKHLKQHKAPRIILLGGSNLSFGINSKTIEDSLKIPVIDMGLHAGLGLKYICLDIIDNVGPGDIVALCPEYCHFFDDEEKVFLGSEELIYVLFDVYPEGRKCIDLKQRLHLFRFLPKYVAEKIYYFPKYALKKTSQNEVPDESNIVYLRNSFNEYGDVVAHYDLENQNFIPNVYCNNLNKETFLFLNEFNERIKQKGGEILFFYPAYNKKAYELNSSYITNANNQLKSTLDIEFMSPEIDGIMDDSCFFNTEYHLNKTGVEIRSQQFIEQFRKLNETRTQKSKSKQL